MSLQGARSQQVLEASPYEALHLLPSAPHELVVEMYWHLVHQIRAQHQDDARLNQMNMAYAALARSEGGASGAVAGSAPERPRGPTSIWPRRQRDGREPPQRRNPYEVLCVSPGAPADVIELAYRFWYLRLRSQWGDATTELEELQQAYQALRQDGPAPEPAEHEHDAESDAPGGVSVPSQQAPASSAAPDAGADRGDAA